MRSQQCRGQAARSIGKRTELIHLRDAVDVGGSIRRFINGIPNIIMSATDGASSGVTAVVAIDGSQQSEQAFTCKFRLCSCFNR